MKLLNPGELAKFVKWVLAPERLEGERAPEEKRSRLGGRGLAGWILSQEELAEEVVVSERPDSGISGFFRWLLSSEELKEETEAETVRGQFGERSPLGWLLSSDSLEAEEPGTAERGAFGDRGFLGWLLMPEPLEEEAAEKRRPSRFGGKGFLHWLLGFDRLPSPENGAPTEKGENGGKS